MANQRHDHSHVVCFGQSAPPCSKGNPSAIVLPPLSSRMAESSDVSCDSCEVSYYSAIQRFYENNTAALDFLRLHGELPSKVKCPRCSSDLKLRTDRYQWECRKRVVNKKNKRVQSCNYSVADHQGTFLKDSHIPAWKILLFVNLWLQKHFSHGLVYEDLGIGREASVNWRSYCSEVAENWYNGQDPIGGRESL